MARGETMSAAVGIGCRSGATAEAIVRLVEEARALAGGGAMTLHAAADLNRPALEEAASQLGWPLIRHEKAELLGVAHLVASHSRRVAGLHGVGSLCEAAALAGAGGWRARIVVAKFSADGVSCAVARGEP
jgi:cobalamin biosynthesis protein CbiG